MRTVLLAVHVAAGTCGLVLGPPILWRLARRPIRNHTHRLEVAYLLAVAAVSASALGLVLNNIGAFWWLAPIAAATCGAAYGAYRLQRRTGLAAITWHARLLGGTYISLLTALLVVSVGGWMSWVLPSLVGAAVVEYITTVRRRLAGADACREELGHAI